MICRQMTGYLDLIGQRTINLRTPDGIELCNFTKIVESNKTKKGVVG